MASYLTISDEMMRKCNLFWTQFCSEMVEHTDARGNTTYKLTGPIDALHLAPFLTDRQKLAIFDIALKCDLPMQSLLEKLAFERDWEDISSNEKYHVPSRLYGTWPHIKMFGLMLEDGSIHT